MLGGKEPDSCCLYPVGVGLPATVHKQMVQLYVCGKSGLHIVSAMRQKLLQFVALAWTKLCGVRWLWGLPFEPGVGAQAGWPVAGGSPRGCWFLVAVGPLGGFFSPFLPFQLVAGYQLIPIVWSALNTSLQNPALILYLTPPPPRQTPTKNLGLFYHEIKCFLAMSDVD